MTAAPPAVALRRITVTVPKNAGWPTQIPVRTPQAVAAARAIEVSRESKSTQVKGVAGELTARAALPLISAQIDSELTRYSVNSHDKGIDILAGTRDGKVLVIEVKNHKDFNLDRPGSNLTKGRNGRPDQMSGEWIEQRLEKAARAGERSTFAQLARLARGGAPVVRVLISTTSTSSLDIFLGLADDDAGWDHAGQVKVI